MISQDRLIPRSMFGVALALPPFLALLFEPQGWRYSTAHQVSSVLAIWLYTVLVAAFLHAMCEQLDKHFASRSWLVRTSITFALTLTLVPPLSYLLVHPLGLVCSGLIGQGDALALRGTMVSVAYLCVGIVAGTILRRASESARKAEEAKRMAVQAKLSVLVARTQPHFLANAMNTAAHLIESDPSAAKTFLADLVDVFRHSVAASQQSHVTLREELRIARAYLSVQKQRFPALSFSIAVDDVLLDELVPSMCILPLVENAVLHGFSEDNARPLSVEIRGYASEDTLSLSVGDNGVGVGVSNHHGSGTALRDLEERLALLHKGRATLSLTANTPRGALATLTLERD